jgi:hypothetical protein
MRDPSVHAPSGSGPVRNVLLSDLSLASQVETFRFTWGCEISGDALKPTGTLGLMG